jgi:nucleoside-diphosphate-sugar epimerase
VGDGVDVLVDVIPLRRADAEQLLSLGSAVGSLIAISTAGVYADRHGRSLGSGEEQFPDFPAPIRERQATVPPDDETYAGGKVAVERALMERPEARATVIRPCAVHGPGDRQSREWYFVKRILDGRPYVVLPYRGRSRFHTTSVENLAELVWLAAERPGSRVINCGDPDPPSVLEIGRAVSAALGHELAEVLLPGPPQGTVGDHPWGVPKPFVMDMTEAELELRYRPVTSYAKAVRTTCEWLVEATAGRDWREVLPNLASQPGDPFDYEAEDAFLDRLRAG